MGNTPMHSPPASSSHRVVLVITTERRLGTSLTVLGNSTQQNENDEEENRVLPFALEGGPISLDEYYAKMEELGARLRRWKGGLYTLILATYSIILLVSSLAAHLTPQLWTSSFFDRPLNSYLMIGALLTLLFLLIAASRWEFLSMRRDIENIYRPWRARGVQTSMAWTETLGKYGSVYNRRQQGSYGFNNFCVIMDIAHEDDEQDSGSVVTAQTIDDLESLHDVQNN